MGRFLLLLLMTLHFQVALGGYEATCSSNICKDNSSTRKNAWQGTEEEEIKFLQSLSLSRYKGYVEPEDNGDYPFGDYICYVSDEYITEAAEVFQKLGAPSLERCISGREKDRHYQEYMALLRDFIDSDEILHKEGAIAYAWTNERGVWLIGLELYVTELTVHVASRSMNQRDFNLFLEKHKKMMDSFRKMFTKTYHAGAQMQMSGLTGDTCRDCWPFLRLYNISLHEMTTSGNMDTMNRFYEIALPFAEQSHAYGIMYEELTDLLKN